MVYSYNILLHKMDQTSDAKLSKSQRKNKNRKKRDAVKKEQTREEREQAIVDEMTRRAAENKKVADKEADPAKTKETDDKVCEEAKRIWDFILVQQREPELRDAWKKLPDGEKLELMSLTFKDFTTTYPIVSKYMVLFNCYSEVAFRKFLKKCRENSPQMSAVGARDKAAMAAMKRAGQVKWCENNAWYGVYLTDAYRKATHPKYKMTKVKRRQIYTSNYEALIGEFDTMDEMKAEAETEVKQRQIRTDKESVSDVITALKDGAYKNLDIAAKQELIGILRSIKQSAN